MYSGCVICEVRNYRGPHLLQREGLPMYDSNLVLLKPTAEVSCNFVCVCVCVCIYIYIYIHTHIYNGSETYMYYINLPTREFIKILSVDHI